jgi:hypothetical protein
MSGRQARADACRDRLSTSVLAIEIDRIFAMQEAQRASMGCHANCQIVMCVCRMDAGEAATTPTRCVILEASLERWNSGVGSSVIMERKIFGIKY